MDVKTAFFHGIIDQLFYIEVLKKIGAALKKSGIFTQKAIYGLKQSPHL